MSDRLDAVLKKLLPWRMAEDLSATGDAEFIAAQLEEYIKANDLSKKEMAAFHDNDGIDVIKDSIAQYGLPTEDRDASGDSRFNLN